MRGRREGSVRTAPSQAREALASERIPYRACVEEHVISTQAGDFVQTLQLTGAPFECAPDAELNAWHERLNVLWRNLASPHLSIWTHFVRRRVSWPAEASSQGSFADALRCSHRAQLIDPAGGGLFENHWYLSAVYRPLPQAASALAWRAAQRPGGDFSLSVQADALAACRKLRQELLAALAVYEPQPLRLTAEEASGLTFLGLLVNGVAEPRSPPTGPLHEALPSARLSFGSEVLEYRTLQGRRWGAMLGIKEYPAATSPAMWQALLTAPFDLLLTQSFTFLSKAAAQGLLQRQAARLTNAGDFALSQTQALRQALDALTSNEFVMGDHHASLQVLSHPVEGAADPAQVLSTVDQMTKDLARARSLLADAGVTTAREDLALEGAFWAQLPGNFPFRPRKAVITSRNFAAFSPFHGFPTGCAAGNHWGEAVTVLKTAAGSAYHFSLHVQDIGHTFICGPTGSGKTAFVAFVIAQLTRFHATQIVLDKDRGLELLVRALGGAYLPLKSGLPTGFNPLTLTPNPESIEFLKTWLLRLTFREGRPLSDAEEVDLEQALRAVLELPLAERRLSRVIEFLDASVADGVYARLAPWCAITQGERAWVFDQPAAGRIVEETQTAAAGQTALGCVSEAGEAEIEAVMPDGPAMEGGPVVDRLVPLLSTSAVIGIDVTEFLNLPEVREPVTLYLFYLVRQLLDGRRLVCWIDEFWRVLGDPGFQRFAVDGPKTWRKLNGVMALATQSPSDVLASPLSRTVVEQTATQVFFPNAQAQWSDYGEGFGLSWREFQLIRDELLPGSRRFLVRQGGRSGVCELDLSALPEALTILSGRAAEVALCERIRAQVGEDPAVWIPAFHAARRAPDPGMASEERSDIQGEWR